MEKNKGLKKMASIALKLTEKSADGHAREFCRFLIGQERVPMKLRETADSKMK